MYGNNFDTEEKTDNSKQQMQILTVMGIVGIGYYLFFFLPSQRSETKKEITDAFSYHSLTTNDLDNSLWKKTKKWESYLDKLYLPNKINKFKENMIEAIETRKKEIDEGKARNLQEARENAINSIKKFAEKEIQAIPSFEKTIKKFCKRINNTSESGITSIIDEANEVIAEQKNKRQKLHWLRKSENWADKKLHILQQEFKQAWNQYCSIINPNDEPRKEPEICTFSASYTINFPPSLWDNLTEEEKQHEKAEELTLRDEVDSYTFNPKIDNWYDKAEIDPVRGDRDKSKIDNNATLYGAPRTGKSIIVEKLAFYADKYPLVVIQGSNLTPNLNDQRCKVDNFKKFIYTICDINNTLVDDFHFERNLESGEPQYIFFIDEANQVSENTLITKSSGLKFLKECTGSDNYKKNESHNLWIIATNHLSEIDEAVYQPGRLANQLNFSWTLGKFKEYASDAGIINEFPEHWLNSELNEEDEKWLSRFNIIHFEESFLGRKINGEILENGVDFWNKFINNEDNKKILNEEEETKIVDEETGETEETAKQKGIQLGEFLQFFWQKFDSGRLWDKEFNAKFKEPREPKINDTIIQASNHISNILDVRLKQIDKSSKKILNEMTIANNTFSENFNDAVSNITTLLGNIGENMK
ncbi:AAA family ATPase [endosymbiont GvMRE of Glomus versiforme]|uniref:AAA family ATPase n=1 Tax=endosymbiont GvMRE of Glomus versiforme TaxID=2039283 RepID=UPI000ED1BFDF|nr:AAA family ATPase [endosymbiont GvMRE of Glomus versiforme]RHZ35671.1 hypothetical protein GvMRE_IIg22 [endosymbiont GvMRE of Glomus versiforme]